MQRALDLAKKGAGKVAPNPMVGAVFVKNGKVIAEGYHQYYGGKHAEVNALMKMTNSQIHGGTLYVTLEPCSHFGKTPPCTNFLISKGVKHIVVATRDPNPLVAGDGIKQLKSEGIKVQEGLLEGESQRLNIQFIKNIMKSMPLLSIKFGLTLDGKISTLKRESGYITNEASRKRVHEMRTKFDAVLTTSDTVLIDNPHLGVRLVKGRDPLRIVIDSKLKTNTTAKVYRDKNVIVATTTGSSLQKRKEFERKGIQLLIYKGSKVPLKTLMKDLYKRKVYSIMTECGSQLVTSLLKLQLCDEVALFFAPKILGLGIPWVQNLGIQNLSKALKLDNVQTERFEDDILISGRIVY